MARMFCLACVKCDTRYASFVGFCLKKGIRIGNPFKNCRVGKYTSHTLDKKGKNLESWFEMRVDMNEERLFYVRKWIELMDWEKGEYE